jgi:hypothetical protein
MAIVEPSEVNGLRADGPERWAARLTDLPATGAADSTCGQGPGNLTFQALSG